MNWDIVGAVGGVIGVLAAAYTATRASAIERLKTELDIRRERFTATYERQLDGIVETYELLVSLEHAAHAVMEHAHDPQVRAKEVLVFVDQVDDATRRLASRLIFLPKSTANNVFRLLYAIHSAVLDPYLEKRLSDAEALMELITGQVPKLRNELEDEFRTIVGIE